MDGKVLVLDFIQVVFLPVVLSNVLENVIVKQQQREVYSIDLFVIGRETQVEKVHRAYENRLVVRIFQGNRIIHYFIIKDHVSITLYLT